MLSASPPHVDQEIQWDTININDVFNNIVENINPLIEDDLKRILQDSNLAAKLCTNPILINTDEINKVSV